MSVQRINRTSRLPNPVGFPGFILSPNGGQVFYCCSLGVQDETTADIASMLFTTLGAALGACRANRGDVIIVLPGHTESVTTTPTFVAGVSIVGIGNGNERPTFNWTASTSQWSIAVANVSIQNCILNLAATAATAVTKAITIAGARFIMDSCYVIAGGAGGTQLATIAIELTTGADRCVFSNVEAYSAVDAAVVSFVKLTNAVDRLMVVDCDWSIGMSATGVGLITMTTAPTNAMIGLNGHGNSFSNTITGSTVALVGVASSTGSAAAFNSLFVMAATGAATAMTATGWQLIENYACAGTAVTGKLVGTVSS